MYMPSKITNSAPMQEREAICKTFLIQQGLGHYSIRKIFTLMQKILKRQQSTLRNMNAKNSGAFLYTAYAVYK